MKSLAEVLECSSQAVWQSYPSWFIWGCVDMLEHTTCAGTWEAPAAREMSDACQEVPGESLGSGVIGPETSPVICTWMWVQRPLVAGAELISSPAISRASRV